MVARTRQAARRRSPPRLPATTTQFADAAEVDAVGRAERLGVGQLRVDLRDLDLAGPRPLLEQPADRVGEQVGTVQGGDELQAAEHGRRLAQPLDRDSGTLGGAGAGPAERTGAPVRIALFVTCLADTLFPAVARATVTLLERLGHEVVFPAGQTCCGQMHVNTGYQARRAAGGAAPRGGLRAVRRGGRAVGVLRRVGAPPARQGRRGGPGTRRWPRRAEAVAARTYELSELLVDVLGVEDVGASFPHRVTYHPTCHSLRMLRVDDKPLRLLRNVRGLDLVELPEADVVLRLRRARSR